MQKGRAIIPTHTIAMVTACLRDLLTSISILPAILSTMEKKPVTPAIKTQKKKIGPRMRERISPNCARIVGKMTNPISKAESDATRWSKGTPLFALIKPMQPKTARPETKEIAKSPIATLSIERGILKEGGLCLEYPVTIPNPRERLKKT